MKIGPGNRLSIAIRPNSAGQVGISSGNQALTRCAFVGTYRLTASKDRKRMKTVRLRPPIAKIR